MNQSKKQVSLIKSNSKNLSQKKYLKIFLKEDFMKYEN